MARTWGYVIASGEDFASSAEVYEFFKTHGVDALLDEGGGYYKYEGKIELDANLAQLVLQGLAFECGWQKDGTVSRFFLEGGE